VPLRDRFVCQILESNFTVESCDRHVSELVRAIWGAMELKCDGGESLDVQLYRITKPTPESYELELPSGPRLRCDTDGELIFELEQDIILSLQQRRSELAFVHGGVIVREELAYVLAADSGSGKSTTVWGMVQAGFSYLSDELAPIEINQHRVWPYTRGLCLKHSQNAPIVPLPDTPSTGYSWHIPVSALPHVAESASYPVAAFLFIDYRSEHTQPEVVELSRGETAARLYSVMLNQLAHPNSGLAAATELASHIPGYYVRAAELSATSALIAETMAH
jgi:hypothetical protein